MTSFVFLHISMVKSTNLTNNTSRDGMLGLFYCTKIAYRFVSVNTVRYRHHNKDIFIIAATGFII